MKASTKLQVQRYWKDVQWAINAAHAKAHGFDTWAEFLSGLQSSSMRHNSPHKDFKYSKLHILTTLTKHIANSNDRDVREAIRLTIDEIIFCSRWDSKTVDRIQAFFIDKMGPFYMEAVGKQGRIQFWEVV